MLSVIQRKRVPAASGAPVQHHQGYTFLPGAEQFAYEPKYPAIATMTAGPVNFSGTGCYYGAAPNPLQLPQLEALQAALISGLGGPQAGMFLTQPLNIPITTNGTQ